MKNSGQPLDERRAESVPRAERRTPKAESPRLTPTERRIRPEGRTPNAESPRLKRQSQNPAALYPRPIPFRKERKEAAGRPELPKGAEGDRPLDERCAGELAHPANALRGSAIVSQAPGSTSRVTCEFSRKRWKTVASKAHAPFAPAGCPCRAPDRLCAYNWLFLRVLQLRDPRYRPAVPRPRRI